MSLEAKSTTIKLGQRSQSVSNQIPWKHILRQESMADGFNKEVHPRETGSRRGQLEKGKGKDGKGAGLCKVVLFR